MSFQDEPGIIRWRLHLRAPVERVYQTLSTDAGRASFWAESAVETNGIIHFIFPNGYTWDAKIVQASAPHLYAVQYIDNSIATFSLAEDGQGGTDLTLTDKGVPEQYRAEVIAGWVSVLLALKAAVDFNVDLRTHDPNRHWDHGYAEN
ncbi:MAG: SRPBCC domain-containing protein [Anaerolineaceae bacterium]|nr:SRPBCC domain-containing protein [Anaerolineaceae bacterium]